jgi:hypothetical protein
MNHKHDDSPEHDGSHQSDSEFHPGNHGFQDSAHGSFDSGQYGQGQPPGAGRAPPAYYDQGVNTGAPRSRPRDDGRDQYESRPPNTDGQYSPGQYGAEQFRSTSPSRPQVGRRWDQTPGQYERGTREQFQQRHDYGALRSNLSGPQPGYGAWPQTSRYNGSGEPHNRGYRGGAQADYNYGGVGHNDGNRAHDAYRHNPFGPSSFAPAGEPNYFGAGAQGYGGGPSFTGGTYGNADERSNAPLFEEVGFNRGYYGDFPGAAAPEYRPSQAPRRYRSGPKGYQRSDERLREDISERLMQAQHIDSSDVTVEVRGAKVILEGTVPDRYMKHAIEDLSDAAPGVQDIDNRIRVANAWSGRVSSRGSSSADQSVSATGPATAPTVSAATNVPANGKHTSAD